MSLPLEKVREAAKQLAAVADELGARKIDATIDVAGEGRDVERYFIRVERLFRKEKQQRAGTRKETVEVFDRSQVTVRDRSSNGNIIVASPLDWL